MTVDDYAFGHITIDGTRYDHDVIVADGRIRKRRKGPSKSRRGEFGHTPLTPDEDLPWDAEALWIGTGAYGRLPVVQELREEADRRGVRLLIEATPDLIERVNRGVPEGTAVLLHVTC